MASAEDPTAYHPAKVLVTVKTYPTPSERHIETVCVAGVRLDTPEPEWIRLYPIPFRVAAFKGYQFKKYQIIDIPIRPRGGHDVRPESFQPRHDKIELGDVIDSKGNWRKRKELLGDLIGQTTSCELLHVNRATTWNLPAPSLGLVKPRDVRLSITAGTPWTDRQRAKAERAVMPDLFTTEAQIHNALEPTPYQLKVKYKCMSEECNTHTQSIIDWEVGSAAYNWRRYYPEDEISDRLHEKWLGMMDESKDLHFFIGNQHQHRESFSILGTWYPKV